jgi:hypothetical protein
MNYAIMIAAAFILATVAIATLSPFDNLPQSAPEQTVAANGGDASDNPSHDDDNDSSSRGGGGGSNIRGHWEAGEEPQ